jgi:hypothetical protein
MRPVWLFLYSIEMPFWTHARQASFWDHHGESTMVTWVAKPSWQIGVQLRSSPCRPGRRVLRLGLGASKACLRTNIGFPGHIRTLPQIILVLPHISLKDILNVFLGDDLILSLGNSNYLKSYWEWFCAKLALKLSPSKSGLDWI